MSQPADVCCWRHERLPSTAATNTELLPSLFSATARYCRRPSAGAHKTNIGARRALASNQLSGVGYGTRASGGRVLHRASGRQPLGTIFSGICTPCWICLEVGYVHSARGRTRAARRHLRAASSTAARRPQGCRSQQLYGTSVPYDGAERWRGQDQGAARRPI